MKKEKKKPIKLLVASLAVLSMLGTSFPASYFNVPVVSAAPKPVLMKAIPKEKPSPKQKSGPKQKPGLKEQTNLKELFVGQSFTFDIFKKEKGAKYQWISSNNSIATVSDKGLVKAIAAGTATISCKIIKHKKANTVTIKVVVTNKHNKPIDTSGFDSDGRMVAYFGSPVIDGTIEPIWKDAQAVTPKFISKGIDTSASFKTLWDDHSLYILAEVKDNAMSVESGTPYMQDSIEIFLDENKDKTQEYGPDDLHFRVNYENKQSVDVGDAERFCSVTKKVYGGYLVETRIGFKATPANQKVLGIDLQINDAKGTERVGTINVFDSTGTAWNDTSKFGEVVLAGKAKGAVSGLNPYNLMNLINKAKKLDQTRYKNPSVITEAIKQSEKVLQDKKSNQKKIDNQYDVLKAAFSKLVLTDEAANEKEFKVVPDEYRSESKKPGTIENLEYKVANLTEGTDIKKLNVYLPYGYDIKDTTKKYNVLYLMHGGGENENLIFGGPGQSKELKKIIDNMIANGDIEPLIVVTPTFYGGKNDTKFFPEELISTVVPLVETKYHTYTTSGDLNDLKASRAHRAFGGFSMGSVTTWYTFINCLDYFKYYMPLSGDCWALGEKAGSDKAKDTAAYLAKVAKDSGYKPQDYYLLCATGNQDIAYPNLKPQIDAMKELKDTFIYSSDMKKGNFYFIVSDGGTHAWNWVNQYIYDILPDLF